MAYAALRRGGGEKVLDRDSVSAYNETRNLGLRNRIAWTCVRRAFVEFFNARLCHGDMRNPKAMVSRGNGVLFLQQGFTWSFFAT